MASDLLELRDANGTLLNKLRWPRQLGPSETVVEDEQLPALLQRVPRLNQRPGGIACFNDHGSFGERRHRDISRGEEEPVPVCRLSRVANNRHLTDDEEAIGDPLL